MAMDSLVTKIESLAATSAGAGVRKYFDVIERALAVGLTLREVADAMAEEGYRINKGLLFWHLGVVRRERGITRPKGKQRGQKGGAPGALQHPPVPIQSSPAPDPVPPQERTVPNETSQPPSDASSPLLASLVARSSTDIADENLPQEIKDKLYVEVEGEMLDVRKDLPPRFTPLNNSFQSNPRSPTKEDMDALRREKALMTKFDRARWDYMKTVKEFAR